MPTRALRQGEEVVVPIAVCVSSQKGMFPLLPDYANFGPFSSFRVQNVKGVRPRINAFDHLVTGPHPWWIGIGVPNVRNVFVTAHRVGFHNAFDLNVSHPIFLVFSVWQPIRPGGTRRSRHFPSSFHMQG